MLIRKEFVPSAFCPAFVSLDVEASQLPIRDNPVVSFNPVRSHGDAELIYDAPNVKHRRLSDRCMRAGLLAQEIDPSKM